MAEVVNVAVALVVIYFIVRWATNSGSGSGSDATSDAAAARLLRFKPKKVTPEMIEGVTTMFPNLPRANIHYDLLRTGSAELTANKILQRGFIEAPPPAYFTLYPAQPPSSRPATAPGAIGSASSSKPRNTLISRFGLEDKIATGVKVDEDAGRKAVYEKTAEEREASLRERKQRMILAARQRLLAQQQKQETTKAA